MYKVSQRLTPKKWLEKFCRASDNAKWKASTNFNFFQDTAGQRVTLSARRD